MSLADIHLEHRDGILVAKLEGEIDLSNAEEIGRALRGGLDNEAPGLVLDLSVVAYLDSAGIHLIYDLRERLQQRGQSVGLVIPGDAPTRDALALADIPSAVACAETLDEAVAAVRASQPPLG
jgi:anti-sigma B factor antagonist